MEEIQLHVTYFKIFYSFFCKITINNIDRSQLNLSPGHPIVWCGYGSHFWFVFYTWVRRLWFALWFAF